VHTLRLNANNFIPVTNEDIERIELVLGPGSALYGPNSANGVMHVITRSPFTSGGTDVSIGFGERSLRKGSVRHAGMVNANLAYKISAQYYTGTDWKYNDPVEDAARAQEVVDVADAADRTLKARDFDIQRQSVEARLDYRPTEEMTAILSYGYNQGDHIELTGLGAGQALDWSYNYVQTRFIYKDLFAQYFHNWSDAGDTFLLRTGTPVVGGLSTGFARRVLRGLGGIGWVGMDVVEVSPPDDVAEITSLAAATLALDYLCLLALDRPKAGA